MRTLSSQCDFILLFLSFLSTLPGVRLFTQEQDGFKESEEVNCKTSINPSK